ncbi:hypothetical protein [Paludibacterium denitrificans]|uniref:hypothetical protein n=1 Tax=Paludibacterium denitrificans TaxID=2675226 RepID=UPI001E3FB962|nr:hypothetical protein [Paludibacterium denitrificans]
MQRNLPGQTDKSVHHLVYSDGLVMMSLFVERRIIVPTRLSICTVPSTWPA